MPCLRTSHKLLCSSLGLVLAAFAWAGQRSAAERLAFIKENPCPSTGNTGQHCPGFEVEHTIPLCAGGADKRSNMTWMRIEDHRYKTRLDLKECAKLRRSRGSSTN